MPRQQLLKQTKPKPPVYLILDNIRSMHNVGAIFRTCDAAGVTALFLCGITATPPRPQIAKTALNTLEHVQWKYYKSTLRLVKILKRKSIQIVALEQSPKSIHFKEFIVNQPLALVLGNEIEGVSAQVLSECEAHLEIPMRGVAHSLNVATAAGIALFELT